LEGLCRIIAEAKDTPKDAALSFRRSRNPPDDARGV
jgi:hypothetical protein